MSALKSDHLCVPGDWGPVEVTISALLVVKGQAIKMCDCEILFSDLHFKLLFVHGSLRRKQWDITCSIYAIHKALSGSITDSTAACPDPLMPPFIHHAINPFARFEMQSFSVCLYIQGSAVLNRTRRASMFASMCCRPHAATPGLCLHTQGMLEHWRQGVIFHVNRIWQGMADLLWNLAWTHRINLTSTTAQSG